MAVWKYAKMYHGEPTLYGIFEDFTEVCMRWSEETGWAESTVRYKERLLCKDLLVHVRNHNEKPAADYTREELLEILRVTQKKAEETCDPETLEDRMTECRNILRSITYAVHAMNLGDDVLSGEAASGKRNVASSDPRNQIERFRKLPKSMTPAEEVQAIRETVVCMEREYGGRAQDNQGAYVGFFLMLAAGLRNGEACGLTFRDLREIREHPGRYYLSIVQTVRSGTREGQIGGKTRNVYRKVPIPRKVAELLLVLRSKREQELRQHPECADVVVDDLPISRHSRKDLRSRCSQDDLSRIGREILRDSGIREQELYVLSRQLLQEEERRRELDLDDAYGAVEREPTSYLARRHFATTMSILGFSILEIRYLMGHDLDENFIRRKDFSDEEVYEMSLRMDRRAVYNPVSAENQSVIRAGEELHLTRAGEVEVELQLENADHYVILAETLHAGDQINLELEADADDGMLLLSSVSVPQTASCENVTLFQNYHAAYSAAGANQVFFPG